MRDFADYVVARFMKSGEWHLSHREAPEHTVNVNLTFRNKDYHFVPSKAHPIKWYPWVDFNWFNPFEMLRYLKYRKLHRTGLLVYKEPESGVVAEPIHVSETMPERKEIFGPAAMKVQVQSPNFTRYQRHQKFGKASASAGWMVYALIGLALLLAILWFTGHLQ